MKKQSRPADPDAAAELAEALRREMESQRARIVAPEEAPAPAEVPPAGFVESCPDVYWRLALPALRLEYVSPAAERLFGCAPREMLGGPDRWGAFVFAADHPRALSGFAAALARGQGEFECRFVRPDGDLRWARVRIWIGARADGKIERLEGITTDITDRKAEEGLQVSGARLRALLDHAADALFIYGADRRILDVNHPACAALGYSREELLALSMDDLEAADPAEAAIDPAATLSGGVPRTQGGRYRRRDGSEFPVEVRIGRLKEDGADLMIAVARDITQHVRAEEIREQLEMQLRQAQKMDAVGRLAGGIAHDFNNMLAVINGYCTLMLETSELTETLRERIGQVAKAGERAAGLTRQLLAFSRNQAVKPQAVQLAETVHQLRRMLSRLLGEDLALEVDTQTTPGPIWADPGQIEQVILNLVLNARDAMPQGGSLRIAVEENDLTTPQMTLLGPMAAGRYIALSVTDTGIGIAPDVLPNIFEPFFTTKPQGQGTGLGLSTVYGILKRCDGYLDVRSRMGEGTTFVLYFPRRWEPEAPSEPQSLAAPKLGRGERILLVEDERLVRLLTRTILVEAGYAVTDVGDPLVVMELYGQNPCPFDLLVTDVVMPGLSGVELAQHLVRQKPELGVLLMSGYTDDVMLRHGVGGAEWSLLAKPFTRAELLERVRQAVGPEPE